MPEKISNLTQSIENNNALRQALVVIEHKIRNLEKRKTKLESYRTIQSSGKELSSDQKAAVAKYDEVAQSLEFARDLSKQMLQIANASEKEEKKRVRKEAILRAQAETAKIREVLTIQNILVAFSDENVRNDFLNGANGAIKLEQNDLNVMEKFCLDIQIKRQESPSDQPFLVSAQKAAEHFSLTIDGRPKQYGDTTYENVKGIFQKIQDSGYLDRAGNEDVIFEEEEASEEQIEECAVNENEQNDPEFVTERMSDVDSTQKVDATSTCPSVLEESQPVKTQISQIIPVQIDQQNNMPKFTSEAPSAAAVPAPAFPPAPQTPVSSVVAPGPIPAQLQQPQIALQQIQRQQGPHQIPLQHAPQPVQQIPAPPAPAQIQGVPAPGHFPPTTVRAVEQAYFKQHQYIQQMRPLAEVIGGGNFFFLQDSELDSPDIIGLPAPPHGFSTGQSQHPQQQPQNQQQTLTENQQANVVNLPTVSPTQAQPLPAVLGVIQQQQNGITTNVQQSSQQQQTQQQQQQQSQPQQSQQQPQINKQSVNSIPTPQANISGQSVPNNLTEQPTAAIPTQTFTNQSFPPIVPPPQVQSMFPQTASNSVNHSSPGIHQQAPVVNINPNVNNEKSQQTSSVASNAPIQQTQPNQSQAPQITQVFNQNHSAMPSITPHQLIAHHQQQQQQTLSAQSQQNVAGTTGNLSLAEQQVAALATLQQQHHNPHPQLQQSTPNQNNLSGLPTGFVNAKFPSNIVSASPVVSVQQQQQTQIPQHHSLSNQASNINSGATSTLSQQSSQDKYDQAVRILEHKTQKIEIKERTNQVQVKDIIATASVNDWETDATKLQMQQQQTSQQVHKPPSHYSTSHNTSHFHAAQHHNTNNNNNTASDRGGPTINESNQWSNDMHTNSQHSGQNSSNNTGSGLSNKNNDWVSTFDSQESNHWNSSEASTNYRGRQSFNRNDRTNGGGPGNSGIRNDRNDNSRGGNSGGYRGRSSYSASQNSNGNPGGPGGGSGGGIAGGNRNPVYFRNNDNYYQNGNNGYNGGNKDNGGSRYGGGNNNAGESYRGRPAPGGSNTGGGPRSGGNGPPPRQQRGSLGNTGGGSGGMGPRGQTGGPRTSSGAYSSRPPRQQDVNVVN